MNIYEGKSIKVASSPICVTLIDGSLNGTAIYIADDSGNFSHNFSDCIFVQDMTPIQNAEAFLKGIENVDKYGSCGLRDKCWKILTELQESSVKGGMYVSRMIAFFCDLGLWQNKKLCQKHLWNKNFQQYLINNMWNYYLI